MTMMRTVVLLLALQLASCEDFTHSTRYAAKRSDYYLRRAGKSSGPACTRLLGAALDMSPSNATVVKRAKKAGCPLPESRSGASSFPIGPIQGWGPSGLPSAECPVKPGVRVKDIFPTPIGFIHASQLDLPDWKKTLNHFRDIATERFESIAEERRMKFRQVNSAFFNRQITKPEQAQMASDVWPEMYGSEEYRRYAKAAKKVCVSFARKLGLPLSKEEAKNMEVYMWTAVYPKARKSDPVTHLYHAHQGSFISFVMFVSMPEPTTPLTLADPRGLPPVEDYDYVQGKGDLGVDGEPPFHRPVEFYAGIGDIIVFPSYLIHKVPPHIGKGVRVAFPGNCHLPTRPSMDSSENSWDYWLRFSRWPAPGLLEVKDARPAAVPAYRTHAEEALAKAYSGRDPFIKLWEVMNQVVAMLQFAPHDAQVWLAAGNLSARVAVLMSANGDGEYWMDTAAFLVRALRLDPTVKPSVKKLIKELSPTSRKGDRLMQGYEESRRLVGLIKDWKSLGNSEFMQFQHAAINGPKNCRRMCPSSSPPPLGDLLTAGFFSSRVLIAAVASNKSEEEVILGLAKDLLGDAAGRVEFGPRPACWWRDQRATLAGVMCDNAASVWFADPRGAWPQHWEGSISSSSAMWPSSCGAPLGSEPKAPFHQHVILECSAGDVMLFPAWLAHELGPGSKIAARPFVINVPLPIGEMAGWSLPELHPHCAELGKKDSKLEEKAEHIRSEL